MKLVSGVFCRALKTKSFLSTRNATKGMALVLSAFLLFNTGFVYTIAGIGSSIADPTWAIDHGSPSNRLSLYNGYTPADEISGAVWLSQRGNTALEVYSDYRSRNNALNAYAMISRTEGLLISATTKKIDEGSYVYLRRLNLFDDLIEGARSATGLADVFNATTITASLSQKANLIYSSEGSEIYYTVTSVPLNSSAY